MARTKTVTYSKTFPLTKEGAYEKIIVERELFEGDDERKELYEAKRIVTDFHFESNKAEEKKEVAAKTKMEVDLVTEGQWLQVKEKLQSIKFREEAAAYLDSTDFKLTVEAKNIVNLKPLQTNEKGNNKK